MADITNLFHKLTLDIATRGDARTLHSCRRDEGTTLEYWHELSQRKRDMTTSILQEYDNTKPEARDPVRTYNRLHGILAPEPTRRDI